MTSCNSKTAEETAPASKSLILYYSASGTTKAVAEELQSLTGADMEAIECVTPYSGEDIMATMMRVQQEQSEGKLPEINPLQANPADYDVIFLAYPIWGGTYAYPVAAALEGNDFEGKTIVPITTFGSGGLESSTKALKAKLPKANIVEGYGVRQARLEAMPKELKRYLIVNGYLEGEVAELPDYGEEHPVTAEETAIYTEATAGYPFPMGDAVSVQSRDTEDGVDYKFNVVSKGFDGSEAKGVVYVIAAPDAAPVFTKAVR